MNRYYIYKLTFRNGCTYIGKHHQIKENDKYVTSSSYYKKHKDLLERREIILDNLKDADTCDIMETICILSDICNSPFNVNYNKGAWLNNSKFDRGFRGPANGMWGKHFSSETKLKMSKAWTEERRKSHHKQTAGRKHPQNIAMNKSPEHIAKVREGNIRFIKQHYYFRYIYDNEIFVDYETYQMLGRAGFSRGYFRKVPISSDLKIIDFYDFLQYHKNHYFLSLHKKKTYKDGKSPSQGKHWFNNGIIEIYDYEQPEGYEKGRLPISKEARKNRSVSMLRRYANGWTHPMTNKAAWNKGLKMSEKQKEKLIKNIIDNESGIVYKGVDDLCTKLNISKCKYYRDRKNGRFSITSK